MNRYKKLLQNSSLFLIANFGSKILTFLLVRFYTEVLTVEEYGIADLINTTAGLAFPLVTLCMTDAVLRFSIDEIEDRNKVFSNGITVTLAGNLVFLFIMPLLYRLEGMRQNVLLLYFLTLTNSLNAVIVHFTRGIGKSKIFAAAGLIQTALQISFNLLFLLAFSWGVKGYILSSILTNVCTSGIVFIWAGLSGYIDLHIDITYMKLMLIYAIPLIPNSVFWWLMQSSDRYVITYMLTSADNGLYAVAHKIPTIIATVSTVFFQAWQLSSVDESHAIDKNKFYSNVFRIFSLVLLGSSSFIMVILQPLYRVLVEESYYAGWRCTPFLLCAMLFSCYSSFLGTNYVAMKKTKGILYTTIAGALLNVVLNVALTPLIGIYGTALATAVSFMVTWIVRAYDTRKFVKISYPVKTFVIPLLIVLSQAILLTIGIKAIYLQLVFFALLMMCYCKDLTDIIRKVLTYGKIYIKSRKK